MYNSNGVFYNGEHSISFGQVEDGEFVIEANTWDQWHLIPSSRPVVPGPDASIKMVSIPGRDDPIDLTDYLSNGANRKNRRGSFSFYAIGNLENTKRKMLAVLHGKQLCMQLQDDPGTYYQGRFEVGAISRANGGYPTITISYELHPYRRSV